MLKFLITLSISSLLFLSCSDSKKTKPESAQETDQLEEKVTEKKEIVRTEYRLDESRSSMRWIGRKPTGEHRGTINFKMGALGLENDEAVHSAIVVDMTSITCTDIEDDEENLDLVNHLKNEDFFDVVNFPDAMFSLNVWSESEDGENKLNRLNGELEIKGIKEALDIEVVKTMNSDTIQLSGTFTFDRTMYNIKYKSKSIFPDLGDKFINDEIEIDFEAWFYKM